MPGRNLNDTERHLAEFWREPSPTFPQPLLKGITLQGPPTLRGIRNTHTPFDYPITAICGKNGVGKSTLLALAAFSALRPDSWHRSERSIPSVRRRLQRMTFAWDEFFFRRPTDPPLTGLIVRFDYTYKGDDIQVSRVRTANGRWANIPDPGRSRATRLPERPIDFISLARILPPAELRELRRQYSRVVNPSVAPLSASSTQAMSSILGAEYSSVGIDRNQGLPLAHCHSDASYSAFDMGSGESSAVAILSALERLPSGGLLLVEEIEHGFHPEAQERLVRELTRLVSGCRKQIVFTTHSEYIIDSLPRAGRLLIEREPSGHRVTCAPTTRQAMYSMTGRPHPELTVYVEDSFAQTLVEQALPGSHRTRVRVIPIGGGAQVVAQLATHLAAPLVGPAIGVLDGDCSDKDFKRWTRDSSVASPELCMRLPGECIPPERWILSALLDEQFCALLADRIHIDQASLASKLATLRSIPDPHVIPREFAKQLALPEHSAAYILASCVADHPDLQTLRNAIASRLTAP